MTNLALRRKTKLGRANRSRGAGNSRLSAKARNAQHEAVKDGTSLFGGRGIGRVGLGTDRARARSQHTLCQSRGAGVCPSPGTR